MLFLDYDVSAPRAADYRFYARKFWKHGPFRWRFDDQPWRTCGADVGLLDTVDLAPFVSASWVDLGTVTLAAGRHVLRIELLDADATVAFDCFLLTTSPFVARGKLKPGEKSGAAPDGWFAFEPDADPFTPSPMDLRAMNEARAGDGGFIQVAGASFVHGRTGAPARFWGVNVGHDILGHQRYELEGFARFLAKRGVNMVRLHGPLWNDKALSDVDPVKLARVHMLVAALAGQGIYLALSSYFPLWLKPSSGPCFEGFTGDKHPFSVPFFNTCFQRMQRSWWRAALTPRNPHTGRSLIDDPALAFIEIVNEDSVFFPTFTPYDGVPAPQMQILERLFAEWLRTHREPTLAQTLARWGGGALRGDDAAGGRAGLMRPGEVVSRRDARARDTAEFLTELQRRYYDDTYRYLKTELGFKGSVTGSNWITADARVLGPLDKWSNAGCDFIDRHGYFGGRHEGATASYQISAGDTYDDALALRFETGRPGELSFGLPLMDLAYQGKPSVISEMSWPAPNRYRTDLPLLAAAYGALQGSDAFFFFAMEGSSWSDHLSKFTIADPALVGLFPAAAVLYRRGLVKTAEPVVHLETDLAGLQALKGLPIAAPHNLDQLRMEGAMPRGRGAGGMNSEGIDPLAFLAGRVEVNITRGGGVSKTADLSALIDRRGRVVRSATGELAWDWGRGLATVDAPQAQGATGLLGQTKAIALGDVTIMSGNDYGSVLLVALDGQPLRSSAKMLVQVMTEDQNTGWSAPGQGLRRIVDPGGQPLVVKNIAGRVTFKRDDAADLKISALDFNGYPVETFRLGPAKELVLRPHTLYYVVQR